MRGYYSLIQYCPDSSRAEAANVGLVLLCPERQFIDCRITNGNDRVRRFFGVAGGALDRLDEMKEALERRIRLERAKLYHLADFEQFIATRANKFLLTEPRNMRVTNPEADLERLYHELVGGRAKGEAIARRGQGISLRPRLRFLFAQPDFRDKVREDVEVHPRFGRPFKADYAFYNGKDSFVMPQTIHVDADQTMREAEVLALRGSQLAKHGLNDRKAELIVPLPDPEGTFADTTRNVALLLQDYDVRPVYADELGELAAEIREHAHKL